MEAKPYTFTELRASAGHVITNADDNSPIENRIFASRIFVGANDSPDNYREITVAEADVLKAEQQRIQAADSHRQ